MLTITANGQQRTYGAHQLVALAFIGPRPEGLEVCHGDGDSSNNCLDNLRYDTKAGNAADQVAHGTAPIGTRNPQAVLNEAQVRLARRLKGKRCNPALAKAWGLSSAALYLIQQGKRWSHVK